MNVMNKLIDGIAVSQTVDVDFDDVKSQAPYITLVPGWVGPMTFACLMRNTIVAAKAQL
mgnify:CR=1 FL=1